jgi:hypothetical protein
MDGPQGAALPQACRLAQKGRANAIGALVGQHL